MGVMARVWEWATKKARATWAKDGPRNAAASALRPYLAGAMPGIWISSHVEEAQKFTGWSYCAITALADQAAQAQVQGYLVGRQRDTTSGRIRKSAGQDSEQQNDRIPLRDKHPMMRLIQKPNPEQDGSEFRYQIMQQLALTGTAHVWIVRNGAETPVEMYVVPTAAATPLPPTNEYPKGQYRVSPLASFSGTVSDDFLPPGSLGPLMSTGGILDARDIKSIRLPHPLYRSDGWSPLAAGDLVVDVEAQLNRARWYTFKNASTPGMVLELAEDAQPSPEEMEAFRNDLRNRNSGVQNAGKDLLLPPGVTAKQITSTAKEMDYTSSYPQVRDSVLALHKTPAVAIGVTEAGSYAAFYASLLQFTELAVQPKLDMIAAKLSEAIAPAFERATGLPDEERLELIFKARAISDPSIREGRIRTLTQAKAITINEVRAEDGLPPVEWGDCPAGTDPIQWQQGQLQLKQAKQQAAQGGGQGGPGAPGGNPLAALLGGGAGGPPGGAGETPPGADAGPAPGQDRQEGEDDDPFADLFSGGDDGADTPIGDISREGEGGGIDVPIGQKTRDGGDEDGPDLEDPVRASMPKAPTNRMRKGYVRLDLAMPTKHTTNGYHTAGRNGRAAL